MNSLMQQALGHDWDKLHPALQAHYQAAPNLDIGHLDIEYPTLCNRCCTCYIAAGHCSTAVGAMSPPA